MARVKKITPEILSLMRMEVPAGSSELPALGDESPEAQWVRQQGWSPVEFLTHMYRNSWLPMDMRLSAAKSLLDYTHRKMPAKLELIADVFGQLDLSKLSDEDLGVLTSIMDKARA